jgi:hypothetical protein
MLAVAPAGGPVKDTEPAAGSATIPRSAGCTLARKGKCGMWRITAAVFAPSVAIHGASDGPSMRCSPANVLCCLSGAAASQLAQHACCDPMGHAREMGSHSGQSSTPQACVNVFPDRLAAAADAPASRTREKVASRAVVRHFR